MDRLIFIRHAQSEHSVRGLMGGWIDSPLTPLGISQANALAAHIATLNLPLDSRCYASDLPRAVETAAILAPALPQAPVLLPELREINTGAAMGHSAAEVAAINDPEPAQPDPDWRPNPTAETYREMTDRLAGAMARIEAEAADTAVVIGHGLSGQSLLHAWLGLPLETMLAFNLDAASLTEISTNPWGERQLEYSNRTIPPL